jgi:hypothetical protein
MSNRGVLLHAPQRPFGACRAIRGAELAVEQLCDMKQRPISKGVIVASGDVADFCTATGWVDRRPTTGRFRFVAWPCYLAGAAQKLFPVLGDGREH